MGQVINFGRDEENKYVLADSLGDFLQEYWQRLETGRYKLLNDNKYFQIVLTDANGLYRQNGGYYNNADIYPGFGAAPAVRQR